MKTKEEILSSKFEEAGINKAWYPDSLKVVLDAMEEYAEEVKNMLVLPVNSLDKYKAEINNSPQYEDDGKIDGEKN